MRRMVPLIIGIVLLSGVAAYAHHSYASTYDTTEQVKLEGKLVQFSFRNPHAFVTIQAPDQKGVQRRWAVEWAGVSQLGAAGVTAETLKIGDEIIIVGRPSRVPSDFRLLMVTLKRPRDGFSWGTRGETVD